MKVKLILLILFSFFSFIGVYWVCSFVQDLKISCTPIQYIAQTGPTKEGIKTEYFSELLGLSTNHLKPLKIDEVEKILKTSPIIKEAQVTLLSSKVLYIDYTLRTPLFFLGNFENIALDEHGKTFPITPFFTPKRLPELILNHPIWSEPISKKHLSLACDLVERIGEKICIKCIDLSHIDSRSLGNHEIILILIQEEEGRHILRLNPKNYQKEIHHYLCMRDQILSKNLIIDLRLKNSAYLCHLDKPFKY